MELNSASQGWLSQVISPLLRDYCLSLMALILGGIILDYTQSLGQPVFWRLIWLFPLGLWVYRLIYFYRFNYYKQFLVLKQEIGRLKFIPKLWIGITLGVVLVNFISGFFLYPYNWDSLAYHLPRVMYFIQHQSTDFFEASYWPQVIHPVYSSYLNIAFYFLGDERLMNLVQFFAGLAASLAVVGITLIFTNKIIVSVLSACVFLNLSQVILQMTSNQNDLLMASGLGISVYFILLWFRDRSLTHAFLASLPFALALGMKASALLYIPSLLFLVLFFFIKTKSFKKSQYLLILPLLMLIVFLTSGYAQNYAKFGHPVGSEAVIKEHAYTENSLPQRVQFGLENMVRYSSHFIALDGLPGHPLIVKLHQGAKQVFLFPFQQIGINLNNSNNSREDFIIAPPYSSEDVAFWGLLGVPIWLTVFSSLWFKPFRPFFPLAVAAILFFVTQSFAGPYDPWRGRYFISCAVFAVPTTSPVWSWRNNWFNLLLSLLLIITALASVSTLAFRFNRPLIPYEGQKSVLQMTRLEQMMVHRETLYQPFQRIYQWLDRHPDLPLYTVLPGDFYEYPLFRGHKVIPLNGFLSGFQPAEVESIEQGLLLYDDRIYPQRHPQDIHFGQHLWGQVISNQ
ncbi:hypothetical protein PN462_01690 [Spirulina sp. CS-785/01]|uniref:hypothetical protein n=1 Tax=Spirulina sp. CS-785/01 TaxID=3021716 RepID=UPI002330FBDC|nr:hypothetical protein [Spirulina sp. CS-785/01]MDB9311797.1 hypothetical protein [Spirulina sp. CS-785/01]